MAKSLVHTKWPLWLLRFVLLLAIALTLMEIASGQTQQRPKGKGRLLKKYVRPKNISKLTNSRINCPVCHGDYMAKKVTIDDPCFNPRYHLPTADLELVSACPLASKNCTTETVYINGVLTQVKRKCGLANPCIEQCVVAGLGLTSKTCTICCPPFDFDTYETDSLKQEGCA